MSSSREPGPAAGRGAPDSGAGARSGYLTKLTIISTLGGLLFGYDTGVISGALLYMKDDLQAHHHHRGRVVVTACCSPAPPSGRCSAASSPTSSAARARCWSAAGCSSGRRALRAPSRRTLAVMMVARIILGFGVGAAAATVPLYLAEMAPADRRGRMVTINELMIVIGQLLAFIINADPRPDHPRPARLAVDARRRRDPRRRALVGMRLPARLTALVRGARAPHEDAARAELQPQPRRGRRPSTGSSPSTPSGISPRTRARRPATCGSSPGCAGSSGSGAAWPRCSRLPGSTP